MIKKTKVPSRIPQPRLIGISLADAGTSILIITDAGQRKVPWQQAVASIDLLASLTELVNSPNAKQNAAWDRARAAIVKAGRGVR